MHLCSLQTDSQHEQKKIGKCETQEFGEQSSQGRTGEPVESPKIMICTIVMNPRSHIEWSATFYKDQLNIYF